MRQFVATFTHEFPGNHILDSVRHTPAGMRRWFERLIVAAEVPRIRLHDLRHTCATLLLSQGVHPKIVQERLGHADIAMTLNRYSHVTPDMQRAAANTLDNVFGKVS